MQPVERCHGGVGRLLDQAEQAGHGIDDGGAGLHPVRAVVGRSGEGSECLAIHSLGSWTRHANDDVSMAPPSGLLSLFRIRAEGAFTDRPTLLAKVVDSAVVWVPGAP